MTPAKLKQREEGADATSERVLTKAEEAKNRLRRNRRSSATSASMGAPLGLGPRASDGGASASVSASVPAHPVNEAAQAPAKSHPACVIRRWGCEPGLVLGAAARRMPLVLVLD